ncbi:hypothetical protein [Kaarinaea lacus]
MGRHSQYSNLAVFNGFGSKGGLWIPYFANLFADYLCEQQPLLSEVDIARVDSK